MRNVCTAIILLIVLSVLPSLSVAQEARTLGGYRFIPTPTVRDPFVTTFFRTATGVAAATGVELPVLVLPTVPPDTLLSLDGDFLFILTEMEYQYAFNNRFTLRGTAVGASRVGITGESILSQGVSAIWGMEIGSTAMLWRGERAMLSARVDVVLSKVLVIDLIGYVDDIVNGNTAVPSLVQAEDRTTTSGGLAGAYALNDWSGLAAYADIGYANGAISGGNTVWSSALSASVDFGQRDQAPIGLLASLALVQPATGLTTSDDLLKSIALGMYFTGRDDLSVGGELKWSDVPLEFGGQNASAVTISGVFRYFF